VAIGFALALDTFRRALSAALTLLLETSVGWLTALDKGVQRPCCGLVCPRLTQASVDRSHTAGAGRAGRNPCANLTCVNSAGPTFDYGAEVWDFGIGGSKWESV
jgi:hypothetical protein